MTMARKRWQYLLLFLTFLSVALAASPTSFCKWYASPHTSQLLLLTPPRS